MCMVGERLGLPLSEVAAMGQSELSTWLAWFKLTADRERKAHDQAKRESKAGRGQRRPPRRMR